MSTQSLVRPIAGMAAMAGGFVLLVACDSSGDFLYEGAIDGVPGVVDLGTLTPVVVTTKEDVTANVIYGELGPSGQAILGGITFDFIGTGESMCVWVDPETVSWNQAVKAQKPIAKWAYPDYAQDDGDLDIFAGLSMFYTGSPGEVFGNFQVRIDDPLGNAVTTSLDVCTLRPGYGDTAFGFNGRAQADMCTIPSTQPGVPYTVAIQGWSVPMDDQRLGYGVILIAGRCEGGDDPLLTRLKLEGTQAQECLITGESISVDAETGAKAKEIGLPDRSWLGVEVAEASRARSVDFETAFCGPGPREFCDAESDALEAEGKFCDWRDPEGGDCFCGDPSDSPIPGAL
jgi:hypothetical protein